MIFVAAICTLALSAQAPKITLKESIAPDSIIRLTPTGAKSLRFAQVSYGVSGGKLLLHEQIRAQQSICCLADDRKG